MTLPGRWYRDRGAQFPEINFSTPRLSLKSFEQGIAHLGRRLYKHRQQQQIKFCRVRSLRGTVPHRKIWHQVTFGISSPDEFLVLPGHILT